MKIETIHIKNYKVFRDITLKDLPNMCVVLGANGTGKTTLFDVFAFLQDALNQNVRQALEKRGGFKEVVSRNRLGPIVIEIKYREKSQSPLITYSISLNLINKQPIVESERLQYRLCQRGKTCKLIDFHEGYGRVLSYEHDKNTSKEEMRTEDKELESPDILAIKGLGQFQQFREIAQLRRMIENWHVSDFRINDARESHQAGYAEHLSLHGENIPLVARYIFDKHPDVFNDVLEKMKRSIPGVKQFAADITLDERIVLKFQDGAFKDPFIAKNTSDGTIKMFAYLLLLHDPHPHPLLAVEEPENQLYPDLLMELAEEFRTYSRRGGQVFITTHSPDFVNGVELDELYYLTKKEGFSQIHHATEIPQLKNLVKEGDTPGYLWRQGLFEGAELN